MSTPVTLPALGESVTEGTVVRWFKAVGEEVTLDEPLLEVSTDKVDTEIPSPAAGVLLEITAAEDETVQVGARLAVIGAAAPAGASVPPTPTPTPTATPVPAPTPAPPTTPQPSAAQLVPRRPVGVPVSVPVPPATLSRAPVLPRAPASFVSPLVRTMAAERGIDLATIKGSGGGGRIRKADLIAAAAPTGSSTATPAPRPEVRGATEKLSRLRQVIATRMVESLQTSAQLTQVMEVDVTRIARLRETAKADFQTREGVKLTYLPFFTAAAIDALKRHPKLNARVDSAAGEVTFFTDVNVAFAVDTERGLVAPVVRNADDLSIPGLARKIADAASRARSNTLTADELTGGTFTVTNLGSFGALFDTPIVNQPQVAILGPGAVVKRAVVVDDPDLGETIAVRHMVYLSLSYDHRLVDGADAGRFLSDVKSRLEAAQFQV